MATSKDNSIVAGESNSDIYSSTGQDFPEERYMSTNNYLYNQQLSPYYRNQLLLRQQLLKQQQLNKLLNHNKAVGTTGSAGTGTGGTGSGIYGTAALTGTLAPGRMNQLGSNRFSRRTSGGMYGIPNR